MVSAPARPNLTLKCLHASWNHALRYLFIHTRYLLRQISFQFSFMNYLHVLDLDWPVEADQSLQVRRMPV